MHITIDKQAQPGTKVLEIALCPDAKKPGEFIGKTDGAIYFLRWPEGFDYQGLKHRTIKVEVMKTLSFGDEVLKKKGTHVARVLELFD